MYPNSSDTFGLKSLLSMSSNTATPNLHHRHVDLDVGPEFAGVVPIIGADCMESPLSKRVPDGSVCLIKLLTLEEPHHHEDVPFRVGMVVQELAEVGPQVTESGEVS
ncbi:MAG: hypothetical protein V9G10_11555 [Candidatus Nanopelagicales bacterium]